MIVGGSTTSLLSFMNSLDPEKYNIDLQLFRNEGPLFSAIPPHVNVLPCAEKYTGKKGRIIKILKCVLKGYAFKALFRGIRTKSKGLMSRGELTTFQAKELCRKNVKKYDFAIGFLEGWSDRYLAYCVNAGVKYAWLHSTFANITSDPGVELPWMKKVDKIVFVTDPCKNDFDKSVPEMAHKTITVANVTDSRIIRSRALDIDPTDNEYNRFVCADAFKLITVCRITMSVKGLDRIVNCASELKKRGFNFLWYIIGAGDDRDALVELIKAHGVEDCVVSIGQRMNPHPFIAAADVMCMPSRYEGKPMTVTESMILGTPPVVTAYLSAHEQINNGTDGIVVENADDTIIPALERCISDRALLQQIKTQLLDGEYGNQHQVAEIEKTLFD